MKTKLFKRIGLLGLSTLAAFALTSNVKAEDNCTEYTNYYFFIGTNNFKNEGQGNNSVQEYVESNGGTWNYTSSTYYAPLAGDQIPKDATYQKVCLSKDGVKDTNSGVACIDDGGNWTLEKFYEEYKKLEQSNDKVEFTKPNGEADSNRYYQVPNTTTRYYDHGVAQTGDNTGYTPLSSKTESILSNGSYFPTKTEVKFTFSGSGPVKIDSERIIKRGDYATVDDNGEYVLDADGKVQYKITAIENLDKYELAALAPTLYKVTYKVCDATFNAKIHYCIEKDDNTCIPATDVDKTATDYSKTDIPNGEGDKVPSHTIKGCKLKKDSDKTVEYTIDNEDYSYEVRYVCETSSNPKTGIALIIAAWAVGLGALGYSAYYFMNARKEENAEL